MKAIIITGDRDAPLDPWEWQVIREMQQADVVIHGACGIDASDSGNWWRTKGIDGMCSQPPIEGCGSEIKMPAPFNREGLKGGPMRNRAMLTVLRQLAFCGYAIEVHAFHDDLTKSKGTKNMAEEAVKAGVPTFLHDSVGSICRM